MWTVNSGDSHESMHIQSHQSRHYLYNTSILSICNCSPTRITLLPKRRRHTTPFCLTRLVCIQCKAEYMVHTWVLIISCIQAIEKISKSREICQILQLINFYLTTFLVEARKCCHSTYAFKNLEKNKLCHI